MVEIAGVRKMYKGGLGKGRAVVALSDVTLELRQGEIFSMLGPNGAGKSTLAKIILGVTIPTDGKAIVFGEEAGHPAAKRRIGFLPEGFLQPSQLKVREALQLWGGFYSIPKKELERRIDEVLKIVNLSENASQKISTLSKGMAQRLGVAQALIHDPDLLILDEPTDGLDPVARREVRELLLEFRGKGKTVYMNSHLLSEVEKVSDRVGFLNHGRLVAIFNLSRESYATIRYSVKVADSDGTARLLRQRGIVATSDPKKSEVVAYGDSTLEKVHHVLNETGTTVESTRSEKIDLEELYVSLIGAEAR